MNFEFFCIEKSVTIIRNTGNNSNNSNKDFQRTEVASEPKTSCRIPQGKSQKKLFKMFMVNRGIQHAGRN